MRKLSIVMMGAVSAFAAPAFAQSAIPQFSGPRVEATLGYDHVGAGSSVDNDNGRDDQSIDGLLYGGGIGYDYALPSGLVLGAEGEITGSTAGSDRRGYGDTFGFGRVDQGRDLYVGGRVGFVVDPRTMIYAKGGYTNSRLNVLAGNTDQTTDADFTLDGYRVGAGVERSLTPRTYAKVEYRYSNYGRANIDYPNGATSGRFDIDTDRHQVAASFGYRF